MTAAQPIYHGPEPMTYHGYTIGLERMADILEELKYLHNEHWDETETLYLPGPVDPDYDRMLDMERTYNLVCFVLRAPSGEIVGNLVFHLNYSLHSKNMLIASEDALFITKDHRTGRLAIKMLEYAERILRSVGVHYLTIGDKSPAGGVSLEKLAGRMGYSPVVKGYVKILED